MANHLQMIDNYIYLYHLKTFVVIPTYPDELQDSMSINYNQTPILSRTAPIFTYGNSGPRTTTINLNLHRDLMTDVNYKLSTTKLNMGEDYVDVLVKQLQACALPAYAVAEKMVNPPVIAVRFGNEFFCKGVVSGAVNITYSGPILTTNKYASVAVNFTISEIDPYDAQTVARVGSFRGLNLSLERNLWKGAGRSLDTYKQTRNL